MTQHIGEWVLVGLLSIPFYFSGLLLWPLKRFLRRHRRFQGKGVFIVFLAQILAYVVVGSLGFFSSIRLEHGYYWFMVLILLNIFFTVAGVIAWSVDAVLEAGHD